MVKIITSNDIKFTRSFAKRHADITMSGFYSALKGHNPLTKNPHKQGSNNSDSWIDGYLMGMHLTLKFGKL